MNKTVRDVVIELKAEWPDFGGLLGGSSTAVIGCSKVTYEIELLGSECNIGLYFIICNESQFNTYVDSLSHDAGKELFQQYLAADKTLLEKETKVDYTSEEFWKGAPEGATHYAEESGVGGSAWFKDVSSCSFNTMKVGHNDWLYVPYGSPLDNRTLIPRPQPKPAFTQEMSDNGELPSVGVECLATLKSSNAPIWFSFTPYYVGSKYIVGHWKEEDREASFGLLSLKFKPLTPPIRLIDGKAYQFDSESVGNCGIYSDEDGLLHGTGNEAVRVEDCTNIKPLTVEVR